MKRFVADGVHQTSVADIAADVGVTERTFFRYFAAKDDVLTEPAREMTARVAAAISAASADLPDPLVLRAALTEMASYALSHRTRLRQLAGWRVVEQRCQHLDMHRYPR